MDRYMRAYRDPKSPLTPLTPLGALSAFTFNINEATTTTTPQQCATPTNTPSSALAAGIQHTLRAALGERFSKDFQRIRNIFEQKSGGRGNSARRQQRGTANARTQQQQQQTQFINGVRIKKEKKEDKENEEEEDDEDEANNERFMTAMGDSKIFLDVPRQRRKNATTTTPSRTPQQQQTQKQPPKRSFLQASPIAPKPLSPRIATLLEQAGAANLKGLFQREEIDSTVLRLMKPEDLKYLGIEDEEDIRRIRGLITGAWNFVRTLKEQK